MTSILLSVSSTLFLQGFNICYHQYLKKKLLHVNNLDKIENVQDLKKYLIKTDLVFFVKKLKKNKAGYDEELNDLILILDNLVDQSQNIIKRWESTWILSNWRCGNVRSIGSDLQLFTQKLISRFFNHMMLDGI